MLESLLLSAAALLGVAGAHWGLRRFERRLAVRLTRSGGASRLWLLHLALLVAKGCFWGAALLFVSERFVLLGGARRFTTDLLTTSLTAPLFHLSGRAFTAVDLLTFPIFVGAIWLAIGLLTRLLRSRVLHHTGLEKGTQESISSLLRYALTFLGVLVLLQARGIDAGSLAIGVSVLGVGIGFGLQNIANNFVSGILIGFERPIRPGDEVQVGEVAGTVEQIGARSTRIRTNDGISVFVPNSRFLEKEVVNYSHGDRPSRLKVPVGVAYGTAPARARAALLEAARSHPRVLRDPRPDVRLVRFGDSALELELHVWISDPRGRRELVSDLNLRIGKELAARGIEIPVPQRAVHVIAPRLERVLEAWARRNFTEAELAEAGSSAGEMSAEAAEGGEPRAWTDIDLASLVESLRGPDGVPIRDRRHLLTVYPSCFVGREAVEWMTTREGVTRDEAVQIGQLLVDRGIIHHVLDEHGFSNGDLFYRFYADETEARRGGGSNAGASSVRRA
jgi:small-conductance mechanosensitive channel